MATGWVSRISGPIPSHPMYDPPPVDDRSRPVPRVRPEASRIAEGHRGGVGPLLELQGQGYGELGSWRQKEPPAVKDHIRENVRRMREIQRASKAREEEHRKPVKPTWKSSKYEAVPSKIREDLDREPPPPRPASADFLRAHQKTGPEPGVEARPLTPIRREPRPEKLTVPRAASAREVRPQRQERDFVRANARAARSARLRRSPSEEVLQETRRRKEESYSNYQRGVVPEYLQRRQYEWHHSAEVARSRQPDPEQPPGHRKMDDGERRETLDLLKATERELLNELVSLPIRTDTLRLRTRKEQLDKKLAEVEEAIKIFSKPKVFVRVD